jgi:hypothetical protein
MSRYSPFDDLEDLYLDGEWWSEICRESYMEVLDDEALARRWFASGVRVSDVRRFVAMGMNPQEAHSWGLSAALVERFRALGFNKSEAQDWANAGIWPDNAVHWRNVGSMTPETAREVIDSCDSPAAALAWTLVEAEAWMIARWARMGENPTARLVEQHEHRLDMEALRA